MSQAPDQAQVAGQNLLLGALLALVAVRLLSLGLYPLMDTTEARYAEMARVMAAVGDWVTPWHDRGVPFWGKPPLSFWLTAFSIRLFGSNEFAARLPHLLAAVTSAWLIWDWAMQRSRQEALVAVSLLMGCALTLVSAGAVMTDMTLALGTTLAMRGFWLGIQAGRPGRQREAWLFYVGLAIGLLAKGPLTLVLVGMPLAAWTLWQRQWTAVWRQLPWLGGSLLVVLLAGPWYVLAELRTPGFLDYFLMGEHWHRFVTPGWSGDRYGLAHSVPHGSIWLYVGAATLPWSLMLPLAAWRWRRRATVAAVAPDADKSLRRYWLVWSLSPLLFFSFASNILWTYALPVLPALALLGARWFTQRHPAHAVNRYLSLGLLLNTLLLAAGTAFLHAHKTDDWHNSQQLVERYLALNQGDTQKPLLFHPQRPYSATFYSRGQAELIPAATKLAERLAQQDALLAVYVGALSQLPSAWLPCLSVLEGHGEYLLFSTRPASVGMPSEKCFATEAR